MIQQLYLLYHIHVFIVPHPCDSHKNTIKSPYPVYAFKIISFHGAVVAANIQACTLPCIIQVGGVDILPIYIST